MNLDNEKMNNELDAASRKLQELTPALRYLIAFASGFVLGFLVKWVAF